MCRKCLKNYFYLTDRNQINDFDVQNYLDKTYDISFSYEQENEMVRSVEGLVQSIGDSKIIIKLNGFGFLPKFDNTQLCFFSSSLIFSKKDEEAHIGDVFLDKFFETEKDFPCFENVNNFESKGNKYIPILNSLVKKTVYKKNAWELILVQE